MRFYIVLSSRSFSQLDLILIHAPQGHQSIRLTAVKQLVDASEAVCLSGPVTITSELAVSAFKIRHPLQVALGSGRHRDGKRDCETLTLRIRVSEGHTDTYLVTQHNIITKDAEDSLVAETDTGLDNVEE